MKTHEDNFQENEFGSKKMKEKNDNKENKSVNKAWSFTRTIEL
jgi:hypothetical protein